MSAASASGIATLLTHPFDVVKVCHPLFVQSATQLAELFLPIDKVAS